MARFRLSVLVRDLVPLQCLQPVDLPYHVRYHVY